ncbi:uncharacterized protein TRUGW13939_00838 [Talaromyces rugulosus]|uniref:Amino acid permease/ SLC12A domain-containing protein n=1 Tax=Talaromyces rugulosus TaxID=121627 RepID=A0A7H8QIG5_TALRU|nr:uncharacterized protein TRUGW13939_00838 [Talaromyces rugulosus]QKX53758.1 hypothetical protein TRUGW13939_00838 [Talaromyces rugulosus]
MGDNVTAVEAQVSQGDGTKAENLAVQRLGYEPELHRTFDLLGMIGFSFSIVSCWSALGGTFSVGLTSGGPPVMVFSWLIISVGALAVGISFAEMCSAYPLAGGQYSWVAAIAPKEWARGLSWVTGWFMLIGLVAMGATNNFITANFVLGMANLINPSYVIERWHTSLVTYAIILLTGMVNIFTPKILDRLGKGIFLWNICAFVVVIIVLLVMNDHKQPASFVFTDFRNDTGMSPALGVIAGLLQTLFGMCCYEAPGHMTEEMNNASRDAPKAIILSVVMGAVTGFIFLVVVFFCTGDLATTANSPTGVPLIQIFHDSIGSARGACALAAIVTVIYFVAANSLMAEGGRSIWAFARDHGLPASKYVSKVDKKFGVPVIAILVCMLIQAALNTIYIGTYTGFVTVTSISTEGFYISYFVPLFARILSHAMGRPVKLDGPFNFGKFGLVCNWIGAIFLLVAIVLFNFPSEAPITAENFNYCIAAVVLVLVLSFSTWILDGRNSFTMPNLEGIEEVCSDTPVIVENDKSHWESS